MESTERTDGQTDAESGFILYIHSSVNKVDNQKKIAYQILPQLGRADILALLCIRKRPTVDNEDFEQMWRIIETSEENNEH